MPMAFLHGAVGEAVEAGDAHIGEALGGAVGVDLGVEVGDERDADGDMLGADEGKEQREVVPRTDGVATGVGAVDVEIALFDVDNEVANHLGGLLNRRMWHLQRCLGREVPALAAQLLELRDEIHPQQRLAAAEADASTRGDEIEVIDSDLVVKLLGRVTWQTLGSLQTAVVEAVSAPQRTAMESRQRGHS